MKMSRKFIGFSANDEYFKKIDDLQQHLSKFSISKLTVTDIMKHAIDELHKNYKEGN